jgi:hypothetical protein
MDIQVFDNRDLGKLTKVHHLPTDHIGRNETCKLCSAYLIEHYEWHSSKPNDPMKVVFGKKYEQTPVSTQVFCPECKIVYAHPKTNSRQLLLYIAAIGDGGGYCQLVLKESFLVSKYHTKIEKDLPPGTLCYWGATPDSSREHMKKNACTIKRINEPWKKEQGYTDDMFKFYKKDMWTDEPALKVILSPKDLFLSPSEKEEKTCIIPFRLFYFPEDFRTAFNELVIV